MYVMRTETFNSVKQWMTDITEVCIATAKITRKWLFRVCSYTHKENNNNTCYIDTYTIMEHTHFHC